MQIQKTKSTKRKAKRYTVVVYVRKRIKRLVIYLPHRIRPLVIAVPINTELRGRVTKRWRVGSTEAYTIRVSATELQKLLDTYVYSNTVTSVSVSNQTRGKGVVKLYALAAVLTVFILYMLRSGRGYANELYTDPRLYRPPWEPSLYVYCTAERMAGLCISHFTQCCGLWRAATATHVVAYLLSSRSISYLGGRTLIRTEGEEKKGEKAYKPVRSISYANPKRKCRNAPNQRRDTV